MLASRQPAKGEEGGVIELSQISDHSDQYGQDYEYAGYDNTAEETDYGTAMAVVDDQAEAQAIQDHANTPSGKYQVDRD